MKKSVLKGVKKTETGVRYMVREKAKPSNVVMEGDKVHCDKYCERSNHICGPDTFESVPMNPTVV